jgi:hypothetical protein
MPVWTADPPKCEGRALISVLLGFVGMYLTCVGLFMKSEDRFPYLPMRMSGKDGLLKFGIGLCAVSFILLKTGI